MVLPPTYKLLPIPTPPATLKAPEFIDVASVWSLILTAPLNERSPLILTSLLNVTGPSNWDRTNRDLPPSTSNLSLTVISSVTKLNLAGSSPVTVATGVSNVTS